MAQIIQHHLLGLHGTNHREGIRQVELRIGELFFGITQIVNLRPSTPLGNGIINKSDTIHSGGVIRQCIVFIDSQMGIDNAHGFLVACLLIVIAQLLILTQLGTYHTQHIVAKHRSIGTHHHKRLIRALLGCSQQLTKFGGKLGLLDT